MSDGVPHANSIPDIEEHGTRAGHRTQDTGHRTQDTGHRTQDTGHRTQDTGHRTQDTGHRTQDTGQWDIRPPFLICATIGCHGTPSEWDPSGSKVLPLTVKQKKNIDCGICHVSLHSTGCSHEVQKVHLFWTMG
ncbi:hypothetical protein F4604DRAFT_1681817 [Suillus subluteus]|nr:hypothetical protein F4604DRAFT_1681817 [Suillus subluteus]